METVNVTIEVPKESKEVIDLVLNLVEDIRAKKDISVIVAENIPSLSSAIEGFDKLGEEVKSDKVGELAAYTVDRITDVLGS